ncbi:unnamed protein product [Closterium sp. NIES-54]
MEVARTSMIHAAAPHFLWPFAVRFAAQQLNLWPHVSLPETSPTLHWTGEVGNASVFRVWGSRAFVRDTSADKLSARAIPCDVTFDKSAHFYRLFPYRSAPPPPAPLFLAPGPPLVDPLPPQDAASRGAASRGAEPGGVQSKGAESRSAEPGGAEPGGAEPVGVEPDGAVLSFLGGAETRGTASSGGPAGALPRLSPWPEPLSPQQLREWFTQRTRLWSGAAITRDSATRNTGAGGAGVTAGAGGTGGGVGGTGAGDPMEPGAAGAGGAGAGGTGAGGAGAGGAGAVDLEARGAGGTVWPRPSFVPLLQ